MPRVRGVGVPPTLLTLLTQQAARGVGVALILLMLLMLPPRQAAHGIGVPLILLMLLMFLRTAGTARVHPPVENVGVALAAASARVPPRGIWGSW